MHKTLKSNEAASFGCFSPDGTEYIITEPFAPPRAQVNFLWNKNLISGLNQFGSGNGVFNNQTLMLNDPKGRVRLIRDGSRYFYLRDQESGAFWNSGVYPSNTPGTKLTTQVGLGYSRFTTKYDGITVESRVFLAPDEPVEIWEFTLRNDTERSRDLWLCPYIEWLLGGYATFSSPYSYLRSGYDAKNQVVSSYNTSDERPHGRYNAFVATDGKITQWCGSRRDFMGPFGSAARPNAMVEGSMACREAWCEELAGAMAIEAKIAPGTSQTVTVLLGSFDTEEEKLRLIGKVLPTSYREAAWQRLGDEKRAMIDAVRVETGDTQVDRLVNIWSKQQIQLCMEFGRDGARGFRDTLQDAWGIAPFNAPLAKLKIKETLAHQYRDGHAVRGWLPLQPHHYSDGPAWIAPTIAAYLKETGDRDFLDEVVPFLDEGEASVLEHMITGIRHLSGDLGAHGLVLAHEGDWNDSLNWMGRAGKGESVWTSMALYHSCNVLVEMAAELLGDPGLEREMRERAERIAAAIQEHGWDGEWYLAGWSDFGNPVGSSKNRQGQIYLNTQTWAVMTGLATGERKMLCLKAIDGILESEHGSLTLWPGYTSVDENVGRVTQLLPGMYENGTPYCHGTAFKIVSDITAGRADEALRSWKKVMPDNADHRSKISGCEPYAFTNQYLGPDNGRAGESISGWITGTAGWMFRAVLEYFCGVKPGYRGITIEPCLPSAWNGVRVHRLLRGKNYEITIDRRADGGYSIQVNGCSCQDGFVPY
ncbi:MAG: GH36-type glycosyl hydrolase domain-containing protein [Chthoniobacteraceae bacterium]